MKWNIFKLKRIFYLLITLAVVCISITSCEREIIIEEDVEGVKEIIEDSASESFEVLHKTFNHLGKTYKVSFNKYEDETRDLEPIEGPDNEYIKSILDDPSSGIVVSADGSTEFLHRTKEEYNKIMKKEFGFSEAQLNKISKNGEDNAKTNAINGYVKFYKHDQSGIHTLCPREYNSSTYRTHMLNTGFTNPSSSQLHSMDDEISEVIIWWNDWVSWDHTASCGETATITLYEHPNFGGKSLTLFFDGNLSYGGNPCNPDVTLGCKRNNWQMGDYKFNWRKKWHDKASSLKTVYTF